MRSVVRQMFELGAIPYSSDEPNDVMYAVGFTDFWDSAPLGDLNDTPDSDE